MDSPTVKIQSSLCPAREMSTANGDAAPLKVKAAAFELKKIGQSSPYIGAANELRVTMMTNVGIQVPARPPPHERPRELFSRDVIPLCHAERNFVAGGRNGLLGGGDDHGSRRLHQR